MKRNKRGSGSSRYSGVGENIECFHIAIPIRRHGLILTQVGFSLRFKTIAIAAFTVHLTESRKRGI